MVEIYGGCWIGSYGDNLNEGVVLIWVKGLFGLIGE